MRNADKIRAMTDEELAEYIPCPYDTAGVELMPCIFDKAEPDAPDFCIARKMQSVCVGMVEKRGRLNEYHKYKNASISKSIR